MVEIAVVGGGPGGLMAAWHLREKLGSLAQVSLFEASDRLGGKIQTAAFPDGPSLYEAGVAEIYDYTMLGADPLNELITRVCGLETTPLDGDAVVLDGRIIHGLDGMRSCYGPQTAGSIANFRARCASMLSREQYYEGSGRDDNDHPWADISQRELLDEEVSDPVARRFLQVMARSDIASEPHLTNGLNALKNMLMDVPGYIGIYSILGGNERLVDELAARIDATVHLRHRVRSIGRTEVGRYRLSLAEGSSRLEREFDLVLVCLPHNWLGSVAFNGEELSRAIADHIAHFDRPAHYLRLAVQFRSRFWESEVQGAWFMTESFGGCCVYDEGSRHPQGGHGVLNWLISGSDALAWVNVPAAELLEAAIDGLPDPLREQGRREFITARVHPFISAVNAIPGGLPVRTARRNHVPEPKRHPGLFLVGDYLFDSTLNGLLDSSDYATDAVVTEVMKLRYASGVSRHSASALSVELPAPSSRIDRTYFKCYRGLGPFAEVWRTVTRTLHLAELAMRVWGVGRGAKLLVAGSASGQVVGALRDLGFDAHGVENDRAIHAQTPQDLRGVNHLATVTRLPFPDGHFDVVIETCLCHVSPRNVPRAVRELHRVTRQGLAFGSVTSDLPSDVLDSFDLLRGVRSLSTWWDWSEVLFDAGFDLAVQDEALLAELWALTTQAGTGPAQWYEDGESLRYCFYSRADAEAAAVARAAE
jgi:monoamine oxidase/SAM-dependent methyltransferase